MRFLRWIRQKVRWAWFCLKWEIVHGRRQRARWQELESRYKHAPPYSPEELRRLILEIHEADNK